MKYTYVALFSRNEHNQIEITFPDLAPHVATFSNTLQEAPHMAIDALTGYIQTTEDFHTPLPPATSQENIKVASNQLAIPIEITTKDDRYHNE